MKVLFCHDGPLEKDEDGEYYGTAHNDDTFKRYYKIGEELRVGIRVEKVSKLEANSKFSKITVKPFNVIECPNISSIKGTLLNRASLKNILYKEIEEIDFLVIRLPSFIGNLSVDIAKNLGKPYLIELVACPWDSFWNHSIKGKIIAPIMYKKTKKRVYNAKNVIYVTNEFLQKRYPTSGESINCSNVSLKDFNDKVILKRIEKIERMNQEGKIIIGTTAAIDVRFKGQRYIIEALGHLKKRGITNYEYQLVGDGNKEYLKKIAEKYDVSEKVKFLGALPHKDVFNWLESIDIYVQPSRQEGLPRALIEAMSMGVPSFGAKTGGIPELLKEEFIFSNNDNKNTNEICNIIKNFNKDKMIEQSKANYLEAKKYEKNIIEKRRMKFFEEFKNIN